MSPISVPSVMGLIGLTKYGPYRPNKMYWPHLVLRTRKKAVGAITAWVAFERVRKQDRLTHIRATLNWPVRHLQKNVKC